MELKRLQHLRTRVATSAQSFPAWLRTGCLGGLKRSRSRAVDYLRRGTPMLRLSVPKALPRFQPVTGVVLIFGAIAAAGGYFAINEFAAARLQRELDRASRNVSSILTKSIDSHVEITKSAAAMFSGPKAKVNRWTFFKFAETLPSKNPGLSAVEWIPQVSKRQRKSFEKRASGDGLFDFHFMQRTEKGRRVKAADRRSYYPVYFVEPYNGNEAELGLDLAADSKGAAFLARVRDSGKMVAAHAELKSAHDTPIPGFSLVMPVYRSSVTPFTVRERRKALSGFVRAKFRFDRLLDALRSGIGELPTLEIYIIDRDAKNKLTVINYFTSRLGDRTAQPVSAASAYQGVFTAVEHEVAGRRWNIVVKPVQGSFQNVLGLTAWGFRRLYADVNRPFVETSDQNAACQRRSRSGEPRQIGLSRHDEP